MLRYIAVHLLTAYEDLPAQEKNLPQSVMQQTCFKIRRHLLCLSLDNLSIISLQTTHNKENRNLHFLLTCHFKVKSS